MKNNIVALVRDALVSAGSTFREDKKQAYKRAIEKETHEKAKWVLETILENASAAQSNHSPLCDDSGIPHLVLEVGENKAVTGKMLDDIKKLITKMQNVVTSDSLLMLSSLLKNKNKIILTIIPITQKISTEK